MEIIKQKDSWGQVRQGIIKQCKNCNKDFFVRLKRAEKQQTCSSLCSNRLKHINSKVECKCALCDVIFYKSPSKISNSRSGLHFCTRKCKDKAQRIGGIEAIMPDHYGQSNTGHGISECKNRGFDTSKCCDCQEDRYYLLCVHHIDSDRTNNTKENLEIVCYNCHAKRHMKCINDKWRVNFKELTPRDLLEQL